MAYSNVLANIKEEEIVGVVQATLAENLVISSMFRMHYDVGAKSINIPSFNALTASDYTGGDIVPENFQDSKGIIDLIQAKSYGAQLKDVDLKELTDKAAELNYVARAIQAGSKALTKEIEIFGLKTLTESAVTATNVVAPVLALDEDNVKAWLLNMHKELDAQEAPDEGRTLTVDPEVARVIGGFGFDSVVSSVNEEAASKGLLGSVLGFNIFKTVNLKAGSTTGKFAIATIQEGNDFGISVNESKISEAPLNFVTYVLGVVKFGGDASQIAYTAVCDVIVA